MPSHVLFHFDYLSPYAYIAWTQIHRLAEATGHRVEPVPTLLAALLSHGKTRGPAEIPAKRAYVFKDSLRTARMLNVAFAPPPAHPFNPLLALRASTVVSGDEQRRLIDALFARAWGGRRAPDARARGPEGIDSPDEVVRAATEAGLDGVALVERASEPAAKQRLRVATDEAIAAGVFGVPTVRVLLSTGTATSPGEVFWGYDSFGHLERYLQGRDLIADVDLEEWRDLPASATRSV